MHGSYPGVHASVGGGAAVAGTVVGEMRGAVGSGTTDGAEVTGSRGAPFVGGAAVVGGAVVGGVVVGTVGVGETDVIVGATAAVGTGGVTDVAVSCPAVGCLSQPAARMAMAITPTTAQ